MGFTVHDPQIAKSHGFHRPGGGTDVLGPGRTD
jgi:hypothetical protein